MAVLKISNLVVGPSDVARLERELISLNDFFVEAQARQPGTAMQTPKLSQTLNQLAKENDINLLDEDLRQKLAQELKRIYEQAPVLHISFATEASPKAMEKLVTWVRANIHPQALIQVGLQPSVAAGCFLRTANKTFDMSLRASLKKSQPLLLKMIAGAVDGR